MLKGPMEINCGRCGVDTALDERACSIMLVGILGTFRSKDRLCHKCTTAFYSKFMHNQEIVESAE